MCITFESSVINLFQNQKHHFTIKILHFAKVQSSINNLHSYWRKTFQKVLWCIKECSTSKVNKCPFLLLKMFHLFTCALYKILTCKKVFYCHPIDQVVNILDWQRTTTEPYGIPGFSSLNLHLGTGGKWKRVRWMKNKLGCFIYLTK